MKQSKVSPSDIVLAGRFDDLWVNPTRENVEYLLNQVIKGNNLAKKWMPRLNSKNHNTANVLRKVVGANQRGYRKLIKSTYTVEHKLSYAVENESSHLEELFGDKNVDHPLVNEIDFEKVPSLAMTKYSRAFSRREDTRDRFNDYLENVKNGKAKVNTSTATVRDAKKLSNANDVIAKEIVKRETVGLDINAIVVLDTSASMTWSGDKGIGIPYDNALAIAHAVSTNSTYEKNKVISFSSEPKLMEIKGDTLKEQYDSMYTGDCSNTDLAKVFEILKGLEKYPDYVIVLSDMEFDRGSNTSMKEWKKLLKDNGAETKLIWWNLNQRNRTSPEFNPDGSIFMSGYDVSSLMMLPGVIDTEEFIDKVLAEYKKNLSKKQVF